MMRNNLLLTLVYISVWFIQLFDPCVGEPEKNGTLLLNSINNTEYPSSQPSNQPTRQPTHLPTHQPTSQPTSQPSYQPFQRPSSQPTDQPFREPTSQPSTSPTNQPTGQNSYQQQQSTETPKIPIEYIVSGLVGGVICITGIYTV